MQKGVSPLTHPLRANQDQDILQIDNNTETLAMAKGQNRFSEGCKNSWPVASPKGKTFQCYGVLHQTNHKK